MNRSCVLTYLCTGVFVILLANNSIAFADTKSSRRIDAQATSTLFKGRLVNSAATGVLCTSQDTQSRMFSIRLIASGQKALVLYAGQALRGTYINGTARVSSSVDHGDPNTDGSNEQQVISISKVMGASGKVTYRQILTTSSGICDVTFKGTLSRMN